MSASATTTRSTPASGSRPTHGPRRLACGLLSALLSGAWLSGCATLPDNAVQERLDERTGTTVTALQRALELVSTAPRRGQSDPFAYLAPFETNRMGTREIYLWVAVPNESRDVTAPQVELDGTPLSLRSLGSDPQTIGLAAFPYATPAPWSSVTLFALDAPALQTLAAAATLEISVSYDAQPVRFTGTQQPAGILTQFLQSLGL